MPRRAINKGSLPDESAQLAVNVMSTLGRRVALTEDCKYMQALYSLTQDQVRQVFKRVLSEAPG